MDAGRAAPEFMNPSLLTIEPRPGWRAIDWRELWRHLDRAMVVHAVRLEWTQGDAGRMLSEMQPSITVWHHGDTAPQQTRPLGAY